MAASAGKRNQPVKDAGETEGYANTTIRIDADDEYGMAAVKAGDEDAAKMERYQESKDPDFDPSNPEPAIPDPEVPVQDTKTQ